MSGDPRIERVMAGIGAIVSGELPRPYAVHAGISVTAGGVVVLRPAAVVSPLVAAGRGQIDAADVGTAMEIGTGGRRRRSDHRVYAEVGMVCVWRVELDQHPGYRGPVPVIFVRTCIGATWRERFVLRGSIQPLPLCLGAAGGDREWISVALDPGRLTC